MQDLIALWHQHWDSIVHYAGVIVPWWVEVKLRLLGILLSWPAVTLYLGLLFMFLFRRQLSEFIGRMTEGEFVGVKVRAAAAQQSATLDPAAIEQKAIDEVASAEGEAKGKATAKGATQTIKPEGFDSSGFGAPVVEEEPNAADQMRGALALMSRWLGFEQTLNLIFGSQLSLLHALQARADGITFLETYSYYGTHQTTMRSNASPWEAWLSWMVTRELITQPRANELYWQLHPNGVEFLDYIHKAYPKMLPVRVG